MALRWFLPNISMNQPQIYPCPLPLGERNGNPLQCSCLENSMDGRSLVGYSPWDCKESDTTEQFHFTSLHFLPLEPPPHRPPHPTPLGCYRAPAWVPWVIQQIPIGFPLKGTTEDEMAGWHHRLDGREFEWTPGVGDGQGGLACCNSWGRKESDTTERLNWTEVT